MPRKRLLIYLCIVILLFGCAYVVRVLTFRPVCKQQYQLAGEHARGFVELEKVQDVPGYIDFSVESVEIIGQSQGFGCVGKITLAVCSPVDISLKISMMSQQSMDNIGGSSSKTVELKADIPQTVTMMYRGWDRGGYWMSITARSGEKNYANIRVEM